MHVQAPWIIQNHAPQYQKKDAGAHWILRHPFGLEVTAVRSSSSQPWTVWNVEGEPRMVEESDEDKIINLLKSMMRNAIEELVSDVQIL